MLKSIVIFCLVVCSACCFNSNDISNFNPDFKVYWNVPSATCRSSNIYFDEIGAKFGIIVNTNDTFRGEKLVLMYNTGVFPSLVEKSGRKDYIYNNGGLPQCGNLTLHLDLFDKNVNEQIPNPGFNGLVVLDFESWRPIFFQNYGTFKPYIDVSRELERKLHPSWNSTLIDAEAARRFEKGARLFMEETLKKAKELRPNARWGYYGFPYCFNKDLPCTQAVQNENDEITWLWNAKDNYHPSVYMSQDGYTAAQRQQMVQTRIDEAQRLKKNNAYPTEKQILLYHWFRYREGDFLTHEDMYNSISTMKNAGIDGVIIWGASEDVNTTTKCENLKEYVDNTLGPILIST